MQCRCVAALVLLLPCAGCVSRGEPEPFTIGQVVSLTGPKREQGEHAKNGAALAIEMAFSGDRRVLGRKVVVRHADDHGDSALAGPEAVRLLTLGHVVAILGGPGSAASAELARAARTYGTPVLLTADLAQVPSGESIFCLAAGPEARGTALARYAIAELHCRDVVALTGSEDPIAVALSAAFVKRWSQAQRDDKSARIQERNCRNEAEWAEWRQRALAAKPDAVLLAAGPEEFLRQRTRLAAAGLRVPVLYGGEDVSATGLADASRDGPPTYLATTFFAGGDLSPDGKTFVAQYEEKFHERPDVGAALAYDGVRLVIDALEHAASAQPARLCTALQTADLTSVTGALSLVNRRANRRLFVVMAREGESKVVATYDRPGE
jgi:branched-chain amino acid transport system substrate-binding protein